MKEEVNLDLTKEIKLIAAQDILRVSGKDVVRLTYTGEIEGNPQVDGDHLECRWFSLEEIKEMDSKELDNYFKELLDKGLFG